MTFSETGRWGKQKLRTAPPQQDYQLHPMIRPNSDVLDNLYLLRCSSTDPDLYTVRIPQVPSSGSFYNYFSQLLTCKEQIRSQPILLEVVLGLFQNHYFHPSIFLRGYFYLTTLTNSGNNDRSMNLVNVIANSFQKAGYKNNSLQIQIYNTYRKQGQTIDMYQRSSSIVQKPVTRSS